MIAPDDDLVRQIVQQAAAAHLHPRGPPMRRLRQLIERAAEVFADRLYAEANAEHGHLLRKRGFDRLVDAKILRPSDRKSTRLNSSHLVISYAVYCLKK